MRARAARSRSASGSTPALLRELAAAADDIAEVVALDPCDASDPAPADPHRHWHAVRVATLGLAIGARHLRALAEAAPRARRPDRLSERLALLGTGLLAHDIGKVGLPESLLVRSAPATSDEQRMLDRHTILGESVMTAAAVPVQVRAAVRAHHEHWDGSGRPDGKTGAAIHVSARITAVADAYDALTTARPYRRALAPHAAVRAIEHAAGTRFDPELVELFSAIVMPYPVGHEIVLPDGRRGVVARVEPERRLSPTVRVADGGQIEEFDVDMAADYELATPASHDGETARFGRASAPGPTVGAGALAP